MTFWIVLIIGFVIRKLPFVIGMFNHEDIQDCHFAIWFPTSKSPVGLIKHQFSSHIIMQLEQVSVTNSKTRKLH